MTFLDSRQVRHIFEGGYGGIALRDLHLDARENGLSLVRAASEALRESSRQRHRLVRPVSLFQRAVTQSRTGGAQKQDEL
mmetsp:Transcript_42522/g.133913  ORF Transcript_42522/g.133913 Transcript_42522/m.133913 type:complete len:80 (+) Transcript_42522:1053-1292(+)